jgi:hypothetical protein
MTRSKQRWVLAARDGLLSGLAGVGAMTVAQLIEIRIRGRQPSNAPAVAAEKVLGIHPRTEAGETALSYAVHILYGALWGVDRGLLGELGLGAVPASAAHLGMVFGAEQAILPVLGIAPPAWKWTKEQAATDLLHHLVYASVTGAVYEWLSRRRGARALW